MKINITIQDGLDIEMSLLQIAHVIKGGRISTTAGKKHYCHCTTWRDGTAVLAGITKKGNDTFSVVKEIR